MLLKTIGPPLEILKHACKKPCPPPPLQNLNGGVQWYKGSIWSRGRGTHLEKEGHLGIGLSASGQLSVYISPQPLPIADTMSWFKQKDFCQFNSDSQLDPALPLGVASTPPSHVSSGLQDPLWVGCDSLASLDSDFHSEVLSQAPSRWYPI